MVLLDLADGWSAEEARPSGHQLAFRRNQDVVVVETDGEIVWRFHEGSGLSSPIAYSHERDSLYYASKQTEHGAVILCTPLSGKKKSVVAEVPDHYTPLWLLSLAPNERELVTFLCPPIEKFKECPKLLARIDTKTGESKTVTLPATTFVPLDVSHERQLVMVYEAHPKTQILVVDFGGQIIAKKRLGLFEQAPKAVFGPNEDEITYAGKHVYRWNIETDTKTVLAKKAGSPRWIGGELSCVRENAFMLVRPGRDELTLLSVRKGKGGERGAAISAVYVSDEGEFVTLQVEGAYEQMPDEKRSPHLEECKPCYATCVISLNEDRVWQFPGFGRDACWVRRKSEGA